MLLQKTPVTTARGRQQRERCERFAAGTADAIGAARQCLFSLLPYEERLRHAASWYEACAEAMLRCNFAPLDEWIRQQACLAAEQHFALEDLLQLLRICRKSAMKIDGWNEDVFSPVDEVINEGLLSIRAKVSWKIPDRLNYLKGAQSEPGLKRILKSSDPLARAEGRGGERRVSSRNRLALPIRVRCTTGRSPGDEVTFTQNVSRSGLYFTTQRDYQIGSPVQVTYPYWKEPGSINKEYSARVTRIDRLPDSSWGVAVEFVQSLRDKAT
jgi:hypothetical protein